MTDSEGYGMGLQTMWERVGDVLVIVTLVTRQTGGAVSNWAMPEGAIRCPCTSDLPGPRHAREATRNADIGEAEFVIDRSDPRTDAHGGDGIFAKSWRRQRGSLSLLAIYFREPNTHASVGAIKYLHARPIYFWVSLA